MDIATIEQMKVQDDGRIICCQHVTMNGEQNYSTTLNIWPYLPRNIDINTFEYYIDEFCDSEPTYYESGNAVIHTYWAKHWSEL